MIETLVSPDIRACHGDERLLVLLYPDAVSSYRVAKFGKNGFPFDRQGGGNPADDYRVIASGPNLSRQQIENLRPLFLDMRGYSMRCKSQHKRYRNPNATEFSARGCYWDPGVVLRFSRDGYDVSVVLYFNCSEWAFDAGGERYGSDGFAEDTRTSGIQLMLRAAVVELFPELAGKIPL